MEKLKKRCMQSEYSKPTITKKFKKEFFRVSISLVAMEKPSPRIGPNRGEINIAPITTGVESAFKPTDAISIEQISIQAVVPFMDISALIEFTVEFLSTSLWKLNILFKKITIPLNKPSAFFLMFGCSEFSLKSNFVSNIYLISFKPVKSDELLILSPKPSIIWILFSLQTFDSGIS